MPPSEQQNDPDHASIAFGPDASAHPDALRFSFSSSSGPGGQNVNKRATKAHLRVHLQDINMHTAALARLRRMGGSAITADGELLISSDEYRSQRRNKQECIDRLRALILRAAAIPKRRKKTKPTRGSVERRLKAKRQRSETKRRRQDPDQ